MGYRSVEKTITDFRGLGSLTDMGVHLHGTLFSEGSVGYSLMIEMEMHKSRKIIIPKNISHAERKPMQNLFVEAYMDYEPNSPDMDRTTWKLFVSIKSHRWWSVQNPRADSEESRFSVERLCCKWRLLVFMVQTFRALESVRTYRLLRPNRFSSNTGILWVLHLFWHGYIPFNNIHFMPNIWINTFTDKALPGG